MNEIDEIMNGKNDEELLVELNFQLQQGESFGGTICSQIIEGISDNVILNDNGEAVKKKTSI